MVSLKTKFARSAFIHFILALSLIPAAISAKGCKSLYKKFTIEQEVPLLHTYQVNEEVRTTAFKANLTKKSGKLIGFITGTITDYFPDFVDSQREIRHRYIVFNFKQGQIVATGNSLYPTDATQILPTDSVIIPVVGGTEKFIGANGQVETTRNLDGTYTHVFKLLR